MRWQSREQSQSPSGSWERTQPPGGEEEEEEEGLEEALPFFPFFDAAEGEEEAGTEAFPFPLLVLFFSASSSSAALLSASASLAAAAAAADEPIVYLRRHPTWNSRSHWSQMIIVRGPNESRSKSCMWQRTQPPYRLGLS